MSIPPEPTSRRSTFSALAATALHLVVAALVLGRDPRSHAPLALAPSPAEQDVEISLTQESTEAPAAPTDRAGASETTQPSVPGGSVATSTSTPGSPQEAPGAASSEAPAGSASPGGIVMFAPPGEPVPGLGVWNGGANPFVGRPSQRDEAAADAADAKRRVEASIKAPLRASDAALGLGPEGPVLRALEEATYGGLADERGWATFRAVVDGGGIVVGVQLLSSSGGLGWNEARERAARALAGKKLALRGAKGAELTIRVESDVRLPSGNDVGRPIRPTLEESKVVVADNAPSDGVTSGVARTYTVSRFDVTDIGAKPRRIVHAHLVETKYLD